MVQIRSVDETGFRLLMELFGGNGEGYEMMRRALTAFFVFRGAKDGDVLADLTMDRVAKLLREGKKIAPPVRPFFFGVAQNIWREASRVTVEVPLDYLLAEPTIPEVDEDSELRSRQLEECLAKLSADERALLLGYYQLEERNAKNTRERLAKNYGIKVKTLRNRAYLLRVQVAECLRHLFFIGTF